MHLKEVLSPFLKGRLLFLRIVMITEALTASVNVYFWHVCFFKHFKDFLKSYCMCIVAAFKVYILGVYLKFTLLAY